MGVGEAACHAFVLALLGLVSAADIGVIGYLFSQYNSQGWFPGRNGVVASRVQSIMIFALFTASWTTLFAFATIIFVLSGALRPMATVGSGVAWLSITIIFWIVSTSLVHDIRWWGGYCYGYPGFSLCRQFSAVEGLGWTALGLSTIAIVTGCIDYAGRDKAEQQQQQQQAAASRV